MAGIRELNRPGGVNYLGGDRFRDRNFASLEMIKLAECRRALLRGDSVVPMTDNDALQANRQVYAGESIAKTRVDRKRMFAYDAKSSALLQNAKVRSVISSTALVDAGGSATTAALSDTMIITESGLRSVAAFRNVTVDTGKTSGIGVVVGPCIADISTGTDIAIVS